MIKTVLFDLDGTLTDTEKIYHIYWVRAAHELGWDTFASEDALRLRSLNEKDADAFIRERFGADCDYMELHDRCFSYVEKEIWEKGVPVKPGVREAVTFLRERGIRCAVVSAGEEERVVRILKEAGLSGYFELVVSAHGAKRGKPHPDPYLIACEKLGEAPADCLAVEDSPNGAMSAIRAGIPTVMVPDLTGPDEELEKRLYAVVPHLADLCGLEILKEKR